MQEKFFFLIFVIFFSLLCTIQDLKERKVSVLVLVLGIVIAFIFQLHIQGLRNSWLCALFPLGTGLFYFLVRCLTQKKLGMADLLFGAFKGLVLCPGWPYVFASILIECLFAFFAFMIYRKKDKGRPLPFIPFMASGLLITYILSIIL